MPTKPNRLEVYVTCMYHTWGPYMGGGGTCTLFIYLFFFLLWVHGMSTTVNAVNGSSLPRGDWFWVFGMDGFERDHRGGAGGFVRTLNKLINSTHSALGRTFFFGPDFFSFFFFFFWALKHGFLESIRRKLYFFICYSGL